MSTNPRRRGSRARQAPDFQAQLHSELFSLERLEEFAQEIGANHKTITGRITAKPLLADAEKSGRLLESAYNQLASDTNHKSVPTPGAEWLLDNYHIVRDTVDEIEVDLPRRYYLQLPRLSEGSWAGYPRVYAAVREMILHTDGIMDTLNVEAFIRGYQVALPLNLGELWAVPAMIRLALVENLASLAEGMLDTRSDTEAANAVANRVLAEAESISSSPNAVVAVPVELEHNPRQITPTFVVRLLQSMRDSGPAVAPVLGWLERELVNAGSSPEEAVRSEFSRQAVVQASVGNTVSSMRRLSTASWADFVERQSVVESLLRTDPAGVYAQMDFATRDRYRHVVERIAWRSGKPEIEVAREAVRLSQAAQAVDPNDFRRSHVGYFLAARGVHKLRAATGYKSRLGEAMSRFVRAYPTTVYIGSIIAVTAFALLVALFFGFNSAFQNHLLLILLVLSLAVFPASELASSLINMAVTLLLPPRVLPKLDLSSGIPAEYSTFVAIPTLFKRPDDVTSLIQHIEVIYLANHDPNLRFAILSDFADAPQEEMPGDADLLLLACEAVEGLNKKYGEADRFYLFHRKRQWNPKEGSGGKGVWMGWERKRGKLADFNALLRGHGGESFTTTVGDLTHLGSTRYVITLDSDTDLPRDSAHRLIGTLAHPLNRADMDQRTRTVTTGYGILQPRVESTWDSASATPFARLSSGHTGVDPYTTAVSNAYQDLFGEGIFIGKGIYDVDAFEEAIRGRFPKDAILSHDLLEGAFARVGLASDITLYEGFPPRYNSYAARAHRWVRGDWQIAGWGIRFRIANFGSRMEKPDPSSDKNTESDQPVIRNPITTINRWKIVDNLRRSLVAPASVLMLGLGWAVPALSPVFWSVSLLLVFAFPLYSHLFNALPRKPTGRPWARHIASVSEDALTNLLYLLLNLVFLAHTAYLMLDAVVRTMARMFITHRHLLEWVTASEAQRTLGTSPLDVLKRMWRAPVISAFLATAILVWRPEAIFVAAPWLLAWLFSPLIAYWVSIPTIPATYIATEAERLYLRRVARKSWRYFEEFVGEKDLWLAPDNYQEYPKGELARRTSPTNLSLLLLSTLSAHDLGYITLSEMVSRVDRTLLSMEKLEKYSGHFYNWYDTRTGQALPPKYISTVDSGNLVGHLIALKNGCRELLDTPLYTEALAQNLRDIAAILKVELETLINEYIKPLQAAQRSTLEALAGRVDAISLQIRDTPHTLVGWAKWTGALVQPTADLATEARKVLSEQIRITEYESRVINGKLGIPPATLRAPHSVEDLAAWANSLARAVRSIDQEISSLTPWASLLSVPPELFNADDQAEIAGHWAGLKTLPDPVPSLNNILIWCNRTIADIRRLRARIEAAGLGSVGATSIRWLEELSRRVASSWAAGDALRKECDKLVARTDSMGREMKFGFLYDEERKLFSIGYNVSDFRRDNSYYDLLASEARLGSYVAVARGDVPQSHWFRLGRPITGNGRDMALISWTGTMFEYLMPNLVMQPYSQSILDQSSLAAVRHQERYGKERGVPWGISEAAYNALDASENYRYRAFGLPELGLKRGLSDDLVVAPYATQLSIGVAPRQALANLRRLTALGLEGRYGFYDSIDFTRSRLTSNEEADRSHGAIVGTYMVHHLGMGLVAINNYLNGDPMVRRFEAEPEVRATMLLLQERTPREAAAIEPHPSETDWERTDREEVAPVVRSYNSPNTDVARAHLISNGRYTVMISNSGAGYSRWGAGSSGIAVTRWRNDWVRDSYGSFIYIRDTQSGAVWSAAAAPFGGEPPGYNARFGLDKAEFFRYERVGGAGIETYMEVVVSPEDDAEIRRVTLTNRGSRTRTLDLTSYVEIALAPQGADEAHPAFSKLFIETEYFAGHGALLASRRPRSATENKNWLIHVVSVSRSDSSTTSALGTPFPEEYETDRMAFLGRGGTPATPRAMMPGQKLGNSEGAVLDPIFSLRQAVRIEPGMRVQVSFVTGAAETKGEAYALTDKYHDPMWDERAIRLALTQAQLELRMLDISVDESMQYQRIFSRMVYPQKATRPSEATLAKNTRGQQSLWAYSISGDFPILLVRIADPTEAPLVRQALRAHEFWQRNGFEADLVILNEYPGGYIQPVQDALEQLVATSHAHQMLNKPGGVFVKRADIMPEADRILLNSVARVVLVGSRGTLDAQLDREIPVTPVRGRIEVGGLRTELNPTRRAISPLFPARPVQPLILASQSPVPTPPQSAFSPDGREYVITLADGEWTPLPWSNVIANPRFGCLLTESGMASTWSENSRENRLTPWSNDPVSDPPSEVIYVLDRESGVVTSPTPLPVRDAETYTIRHGQGYSTYSHNSNGIEQTLRVSVPPEDPVKVCKLTLRNGSNTPKKLTVTYYAELVMGVSREATSRYVITEADQQGGAVFAHNPYNNEFSDRVAFATTSAQAFTFTTDRAEFLGRNRSTQAPNALTSSVQKRQGLSGRVGAGLDPCMTLQCLVDLQPGEVGSITFTLGEGDNAEHARQLAGKYRSIENGDTEYMGTVAMWDRLLSAVEVETPDASMNLLMNRWILYQSITCRIWGRTAFYQSGGAYGFRDQLQDVMALVYSAPEMAREQILRCAERQFVEGDVQHWWHPPTGRGVRTRFSDDLLWLPFVTAYYIEATGDTQILQEERPYLQAPLLNHDQEDMYSKPIVSEESGTVYDHCLRAIRHGTTAGAHGLPLMGAGDWNDGMNRVGIGGTGESVWVGWFLYATLAAFMPLCEERGDKEHTEDFRKEMARLKAALDTQAWDGEWYLRAFYDNGEPMGSAKSEECKIDSIAQSWSVISGAASEERASRAMQSVESHLVQERENMILLFTPPFDKSAQDPGYIKGYLPGVRENGGQYTHAAIWTAVAHAMMGDGDGAYRLFNILNPMSHGRTPDDAARYMVEAYVIAADIYSHPQHIGRGGWTWYTGSASWFYRLGVEYILGLRLHSDHFTIEPSIPSHWPSYKMIYRHKTTTYHISVSVEQPAEGAREQTVELDGKPLSNPGVPLLDDTQAHDVRIVLRESKQRGT